jgi:membrane associated rhomboid family serine protease
MKAEERQRFISSIIFSTLLVAVMWLVKVTELAFHVRFVRLGIMPLEATGLIGIFTAPFIHGSLAHLSANSLPVWVLTSMLFYFYRPIAWRTFFLIYFITGLWVWFWGRESYHIGASGVVYGLASFLFFSGLIRRDNRLLAITFLVAFLYGSLVWGIFPEILPEKNISWESHLMGLISGVVLAFYYKGEGPQRKKYSWDFEEEDDDEDDENAYWNKPLKKPEKRPVIKEQEKKEPWQINYIYKEKKDESEKTGDKSR